jgi:ketosteroid isomerase-like protein
VTFELNLPDVVDEVRAEFESYERALVGRDLAAMKSSFVSSPEVVRFGVADRQRGPEELAQWRANQAPLPPGRHLTETLVTTYGRDVAVVTTLFSYPGRPMTGRQSQTWLRFDDGWRIVHAHVSEVKTSGERGSG